MKKKDTKMSGAALLLIGIVVLAAIVAVAVLFITVPGLLANVIWVILIIIAAIVIAVLVIWALMFVLAIPFYMKKGEGYQTDVSYNMDDVKSVKETSGSDEKK